MRKVYSYIRFSTKKQAKGSSKERQWRVAREFAQKHGYELVEANYADLGVSAYKSVHCTGLQNMLDAVESGAIEKGSIIVIEAVDRLSRKQYQETNELVQRIVSNGVELFVDADNMFYNQSTVNDIDKIMMLAIRCKIAFEESEQKSNRIKAAKDAKKRQGLEGKKAKKVCPKWLTFNDVTQEFELNDYAEAVRYIIKLKQDGGTENTITKDMQSSKYLPPRSKEWNPTSIRRILSQPALYGAWQTRKKVSGKWVDDELILNHYPALVTFEEWVLLTPKKRSRGKRSPQNHFNNITRCAKCNSVLTKKKGVKKEYDRYQCNKAAKQLGCDAPGIKATDLDKLILSYSRFLEVDTGESQDVNNINMEIEKAEKKVKALKLAFEDDDDLDVLDMLKKQKSLIKELKNKLKPITNNAENKLKLSEVFDEPSKWNNLAQQFIDTIFVEVQGEQRKKKFLKITIVQTNGKIIESRHFGTGSKLSWIDAKKWII